MTKHIEITFRHVINEDNHSWLSVFLQFDLCDRGNSKYKILRYSQSIIMSKFKNFILFKIVIPILWRMTKNYM